MKALVSSLLLISAVFCAETPVIVDYDESHKEQIITIALASSQQLFVGSTIRPLSGCAESIMIDCLHDQSKIKKIIIDEDQTVVGFIVFFQEKELYLESMKAKIQGLAIAQSHRRKGYARALLHNAEETIKEQWPEITRVELDVNDKNEAARKLYESENFVRSLNESLPLLTRNGIRYEKQLQPHDENIE